MFCGSCIQPQKQFRVQIIGILEEIDSFYWPKMRLWKGAGPLPSFGQNPKEQQFFFRIPSQSPTYEKFQPLETFPRDLFEILKRRKRLSRIGDQANPMDELFRTALASESSTDIGSTSTHLIILFQLQCYWSVPDLSNILPWISSQKVGRLRLHHLFLAQHLPENDWPADNQVMLFLFNL